MDFLTFILSVIVAVMASTGFWAFLQKNLDKKDNKTKLLIGLGHDRIFELGQKYINRGWVTKDEYENFHDYLYTPYHESGGNGTGERIMNEVNKLPIREREVKTNENDK